MKPKIVYIAHPIGGNVQENLKDLVRILRIINLNIHPQNPDKLINLVSEWHNGNSSLKLHEFLNLTKDDYEQYVKHDRFENTYEFSNIVPVAPYYADIIALDDNVAEERARGIANDIELIKTGVFKELWLTGNKISHGMHEEIKLFQELHIPVVNYVGKI